MALNRDLTRIDTFLVVPAFVFPDRFLLIQTGGYNFTNTSRTWANVMASLLNKELDSNIPEHEVG